MNPLLLSAMLAAAWLLLQQSIALPQLITAALLGWGIPRLVRGFLLPAVPAPSGAGPGRRAGVALRLLAIVLWDIVLSNLIVARLVLSPRARPRPAWVRVPLRLQDPTAITLLAAIITTTPGTVSCVVDEARREIVVHALDCDDDTALAGQIQQRYETPLMEIFE